MANHKSAIKRARQNEIRRLRNKAVRTRIKKVTKSVRQSGADDATAIMNQAKSVIDKAAKKGVIHRNTAARKISRLSRIASGSQS